MRVMLLNDNGNIPHVGCLAVSDAHARMLGRAGHHVVRRFFNGEMLRFANADPTAGLQAVLADREMREAMEAVDAVIVNGEGTIHHDAGTQYLHIMAAAKALGKTAILVNAVLEAVEGFDHVFHMLDDITVRESRSLRFLQARGIQGRLVHDSFLEAGFYDYALFDLADRIVITDWHHDRDAELSGTLLQYMRGLPKDRAWYMPLMCHDVAEMWFAVPRTWGAARAVITGRHHGIYAALLMGVPFVALSSNTHKIEGLIEEFPDLAFCLNPSSIERAVEMAVERRPLYIQMRDAMIAHRPLSTFAALGGEADAGGTERELDRLAKDVQSRPDCRRMSAAYRIRRRSDEMLL